MMYLLRR